MGCICDRAFVFTLPDGINTYFKHYVRHPKYFMFPLYKRKYVLRSFILQGERDVSQYYL